MADNPYYHHHDSDHQLSPSPAQHKSDPKPQATFLTKLYALLERPENHHMIRWDAEGKHIIVERPEQLALHVLPSIYRQSRFASFSRQLNIYGFMRKVNLRNVDPSIDDPDASTWSHPSLDRNSPPEVVANFKRRVPPRLPKPRKRPPESSLDPSSSLSQPRSANGLGVPLTVPSSVTIPSPQQSSYQRGRSRGFSAPSPYSHPPPPPPSTVSASSGWGSTPYSRHPLPPLTVPPEHPSHYAHHQSHPQHHHHHHQMHPSSIPPMASPDDSQATTAFSPSGYPAPSSHYSSYPSSHSYAYSGHETGSAWSVPPPNPGSASAGNSLSSLLNPSSNYPGRPSIQTSYLSHHSAYSIGANQSPVSVSPDSRPTTGYSVASSLSSIAYEPSNASHDYDSSRPTSSQRGRPLSPIRGHSPTYPKAAYSSSLIMRRDRRHSHAMSPYPSPYDSDGRPMTAPGHPDSPSSTDPGSIPRVKSLMHVPPGEHSAGPYGYPHAQLSTADFAYSANGSATSLLQANGLPAPAESADRTWIPPVPPGQDASMDPSGHILRPSTSASSLSAASQGSTASTGNTPPSGLDPHSNSAHHHHGVGEQEYHRFMPSFAFHPAENNLNENNPRLPEELLVDA